jgi:hypothetical protein
LVMWPLVAAARAWPAAAARALSSGSARCAGGAERWQALGRGQKVSNEPEFIATVFGFELPTHEHVHNSPSPLASERPCRVALACVESERTSVNRQIIHRMPQTNACSLVSTNKSSSDHSHPRGVGWHAQHAVVRKRHRARQCVHGMRRVVGGARCMRSCS